MTLTPLSPLASRHGNIHSNPAAAWRHIDAFLVAAVVGLVLFGTVVIHSATRHGDDPLAFVKRHVLFVVLGGGLAVLAAAVDYHRYRDWWPFLYGGALALLLGVLTPLGREVNGTQGWYELGPLQFQPAEMSKVVVVVAAAAFLGSATAPLDVRRLVSALLLFGVPFGIIMMQPDLGTALVFVAIAAGMLVVGGAEFRHLGILGLVTVVGVIGIINSDFLEDYQVARLTAFVDPDRVSADDVYNVEQAQIAISTGGVTGFGLGDGPQTRGGYVPEQQTDFIFTVVGEELGFVGGAVLLLLYGAVSWRIWRTAQLSRDQTGTLICVGVLCMLAFQMFQNIGMTMGIMPITGIPLPFISYGGSATMANFIAMGLVVNVHMRRFS